MLSISLRLLFRFSFSVVSLGGDVGVYYVFEFSEALIDPNPPFFCGLETLSFSLYLSEIDLSLSYFGSSYGTFLSSSCLNPIDSSI